MKSIRSVLLALALFLSMLLRLLASRRLVPAPRRWLRLANLVLALMVTLSASCNSLGKPERQPSPAPPDCKQRAPARDSGDPPSGADVYDWMAWARAYVVAQWAIVDRDNKRAATADCLDETAKIRP